MMSTPHELSERDLAILRAGIATPSQRMDAAFALGLSVPALIQRFSVLLDDELAAIAEPQIVARGRELRARNARRRVRAWR